MKKVQIFCDFCGKDIDKNKGFTDIDLVIVNPEKKENYKFKSGEICSDCGNKIKDFIDQLKTIEP